MQHDDRNDAFVTIKISQTDYIVSIPLPNSFME